MLYLENSKEMFRIYDEKSERIERYFAKMFLFGTYKLNQILSWVTSTSQMWLITKEIVEILTEGLNIWKLYTLF